MIFPASEIPDVDNVLLMLRSSCAMLVLANDHLPTESKLSKVELDAMIYLHEQAVGYMQQVPGRCQHHQQFQHCVRAVEHMAAVARASVPPPRPARQVVQ